MRIFNPDYKSLPAAGRLIKQELGLQIPATNARLSEIKDISERTGVNGKPHALTSISGVPENFPAESLSVSYTDFKKIKTLTEGSKYYEIAYGVDDQRRKSIYKENGTTKETRYYLGNYEEKILPNGNIQKIHYLSGAILIQGGSEETLYYAYSDYLGSLVALTNEAGNVVEHYAYDPWGQRRNPADWTQKDTRTTWIVNRGYTGHEHLSPFGGAGGGCIINMNGRVYDPLTASFFSPDPYVQAPDYWLNYNRYAYAYGNPFLYTDPDGELQIGPFYISLNLGWGYGNGFYFGISAGVGIEGMASAGISIGYNTSGSFSFSASAGIAGFYASAGYDTKGGWNASAGWSAPIPSLGIVSFNTNMLGVSGSYSQNGGWSYNHMGMSFSKNGVSFSPSVGMSVNALTYYSNKEIDLNNELCSMSESKFKSKQEMMDYLKSINRNASDIDADQIRYVDNYHGNNTLGVTHTTIIFGKISHIEIVMFPHKTLDGFNLTFNHETIHVYHHRKYGEMDNTNGNYSETVAYRYSNLGLLNKC